MFESLSHVIESNLLKGFIIGMSVAVPIGPIAIFCIRQTLTYGLISGIVAGFAASLGDGFYSFIAALFSNLANLEETKFAFWFYLFGGFALIFIGVRIFRSVVAENEGLHNPEPKLWSTFFDTLILTFASPMTTVLFISLFGSFGVFKHHLTHMDTFLLVFGVFLGAMAWWVILSLVVNKVRSRLSPRLFSWANRISGTAIVSFGLATVAQAIWG